MQYPREGFLTFRPKEPNLGEESQATWKGPGPLVVVSFWRPYRWKLGE